MTNISKTALALAAAALCLTSTAALAHGGHPRVREVNARLENQHDRIAAGLKDHQLTPGVARGLRQEDRGIRKEENTMRALDGGHLTKADQKSLNQQENDVSQQIYTDRH